ncbi:hypothetical protein GF337_00365 [candidate division KSB1 bacterium]|nr:hypothetical protein [candidate division KSB1 bacterium]
MMQQKKKNTIDIKEYLQLFLRRKYYFIIPFAVTIILGIIYCFVANPLYQSYTVVQISQGQLLSRQMQNLVPGVTAQERLNNLRRLITSHNYLKRLIETLDLYKDPKLRNIAEENKSAYPGLSVNEIIELFWIERLQEHLTISQLGSDFVRITATGNTPDMAYNLAHTLTQIFIDESLRREVGGIRGALQFSSEQLTIYKNKLEESEEKLRRFKEDMLRDDFDSQTFISNNLDEVNKSLTATDFELREARDRLKFLRNKLSRMSANNHSFRSARLNNLENNLLSSVTKLSELMLKYSWEDVNVLKLNSEIDRLQIEIRNEIESLVRAHSATGTSEYVDAVVEKEIAEINIKFLNRKKNVFSNLVKTYRRKIAEGPSKEMQLSRLQREVESNREIYQTLLQQARGSEIEEALQRTAAEFKFKVIQPALKPLHPIKPNRMKIMLMAAALGIAIGIGLIYGLEYIDRSFKNVEEVERYLHLPVLGTIPKIEKDTTFDYDPFSMKGFR